MQHSNFAMSVRDWRRGLPATLAQEAVNPDVTAATPDQLDGANEMGEIAQTGGGIVNWVINNLPGEMHLYDKARKLKYEYCGPGTRLKMRLARGDAGINELDRACKDHDVFYLNNRTAESRKEGDLLLAEAAAKVARDSNATNEEKEKANLVIAIMHGKQWLGAGAGAGAGSGEGGAGAGPSLISAIGSLLDYLLRRHGEETAKKKAAAAEREKKAAAEAKRPKWIK